MAGLSVQKGSVESEESEGSMGFTAGLQAFGRFWVLSLQEGEGSQTLPARGRGGGGEGVQT